MQPRNEARVVCECGHEGVLRWTESKPVANKQWESYRISGFEGVGFRTYGWITVEQALKRMAPSCPVCATAGKVRHA